MTRYGSLIGTFADAPADHPVAAGMCAGSVTDDTGQAVLLAQVMIEHGGRPDPADLARRLLSWEESMCARGSHDLLGPSTKQAISALLAGVHPGQAGRNGTTSGAAMRITLVGIATPGADLDLLVDRVVEASRATHNTGVALAGAAAVAAAVSAEIDGAAPADAIRVAVAAAERAAYRGHWVAGADVASRITWPTGLAAGLSTSEVIDIVGRLPADPPGR
jgi:ADP-ribosylglycohydrolase